MANTAIILVYDPAEDTDGDTTHAEDPFRGISVLAIEEADEPLSSRFRGMYDDIIEPHRQDSPGCKYHITEV